jgi:hypothetical protein
MGTSGVIAALSSALFVGGAVYINLVEHPARMSCGTEIALSEFAPSYQRATVVQVSLAVTAALAGVVAWLMTDAALWLVGAICIITNGRVRSLPPRVIVGDLSRRQLTVVHHRRLEETGAGSSARGERASGARFSNA